MKFIVFAVMFIASITLNMVNIPEETYSVELTEQEVIKHIEKKLSEDRDDLRCNKPLDIAMAKTIPDKNLFSFHIYSDIFYPPQFKPPIS